MQFFKGPFYFYIKYDKCRGFSFQYFMGLISDTKKYEEYKDKESKGLKQKMDRKRSMSPDPEDGEDKTVKNKSSNKRKKIGSTMHNKNKYDKVGDKKSERRKRRSESNDDSDSDSEKKRRRERSNSNSNDSYKLKRLKKSKKRKKYDCSSERSSKNDHLVGSNIFQERIRSFYFQDKLYNFIYTDFIIKCIFTKVYFFSYP